MARAATTADVYNAIAEPRRRRIIDELARGGPREVGELVTTLDLPQPTVSKHLGVLRKVGLVAVQRRGRHREYSVNAQVLKPVHDWIKTYERFWDHQLARIKESAEQKAREKSASKKPDHTKEP
jgi:DNA-binding transcriptional ArsR family regulator